MTSNHTRDNRPNILFLFTDQQSARAMSVYGNPWLKTPHMDSIAANGVTFTSSYCTSPVCGPARASLLTGRYPHETGVNYNGTGVDPSIPNIGQVFEAAGYTTAYAGKWHLPASYPTTNRIPGCEYLLPKDRPEGYLTGARIDSKATDAAIECLRRNPEMLFDLKDDPGETKNLINAPSARAIIDQHRNILKEWIVNTNDIFEIPSRCLQQGRE